GMAACTGALSLIEEERTRLADTERLTLAAAKRMSTPALREEANREREREEEKDLGASEFTVTGRDSQGEGERETGAMTGTLMRSRSGGATGSAFGFQPTPVPASHYRQHSLSKKRVGGSDIVELDTAAIERERERAGTPVQSVYRPHSVLRASGYRTLREEE
ncbi:hypothetical protein KIPB_011837, partial [Kipferlia bialata]